jgi:membrane-associated phospholipid phosphatase
VTQSEGYGAASAVLFVIFLAFGWLTARTELATFDVWAAAWRLQAIRLAAFFTITGRSRAMFAFYAAAIVIYWAAHLAVWVALIMALSQIVSQTAVEMFKLFFRRVRPEYWVVALDRGHSYPSGHSVTAVVFFVGWAVIAAGSGLAPAWRDLAVALLFAWAFGIAWSRLALGAHYLSDVIGGVVFGSSWLCMLAAVAGGLLRG